MNKPHITAVVLAAGQSTRMGTPKLLLPWGDTTILGATIRQVQGTTVEQIILVSGAYRESVEAVAAAQGVTALYNPDYAQGEILSSLQVAVRWLQSNQPTCAGLLVLLGDLPFLPTAVLETILHTFRTRPAPLVAPVYAGQKGHPVLISQSLWGELLALPPHGAPRDLFKRHHHDTLTVPVATDLILRDIDTPADYEQWRPR
jgi:molybdenum cofactor cytidylyltransferase